MIGYLFHTWFNDKLICNLLLIIPHDCARTYILWSFIHFIALKYLTKALSLLLSIQAQVDVISVVGFCVCFYVFVCFVHY